MIRENGYCWVKNADEKLNDEYWSIVEYHNGHGWYVGPEWSTSEYVDDSEFDEIDENRITRD